LMLSTFTFICFSITMLLSSIWLNHKSYKFISWAGILFPVLGFLTSLVLIWLDEALPASVFDFMFSYSLPTFIVISITLAFSSLLLRVRTKSVIMRYATSLTILFAVLLSSLILFMTLFDSFIENNENGLIKIMASLLTLVAFGFISSHILYKFYPGAKE
jgi:hypothetical protein